MIIIKSCVHGKDINETVYDATKRPLKEYNCRIMYYDELLRNVENLYSDFLKKKQGIINSKRFD